MASKNLGAVIQRAISDGAFRRQLQSDPAAALRGFNLTPDEIAAIRSGDSGKLMSLGVDQRMSKVFSVSGSGMLGGAARASVSDLAAGSTSSAISDANPGTREGIVGDPTSPTREGLTADNPSGARAIVDNPPFDGRSGLSDPTAANTRAIHDSGPDDLRGTVTTGDISSTRAVNDSEPFAGDAVINDNIAAANAGRGGSLTGDISGSGASAADDPYSGTYQGVSPDFQAGLSQAAASEGTAGAGGSMISADDNFSVASRMADPGTADAVRAIHDVAPFGDGNLDAAAPSGNEFLGGDARLDPGIDSAHGFVPSDSADVQRELLDHGNALGDTGDTGVDKGDEHSWG